MPTIEISQKVLEKLVGRKIGLDDFEVVKGSVDSQEGDKIKLEIGDTNRPDLWSIEGVARVLRGYYGLERGIPKLKIKPSGKRIIVNKNIRSIRPFIAGFIAKKLKITEELLLDMIQIQEKICENYGKKRQKISVGIYDYDKIEFPVHYKAVAPDMIKFTPLEKEKPMTLAEILKEHPKGIQYGYILKEHKLYPIFIDSKEDVLSFPPIINSNYLGRVEPGMQNVFVEITGTDMKTVLISTNILAQALYDRGALLESVIVEYPWKTQYGRRVITPFLFKERIAFGKENIRKVLGIEVADKDIKVLLEKMRYSVLSITKNSVSIEIPPYRNDVMHYVDVIEDLAISYGYDKPKELEMKSFTVGKLKDLTVFLKKCKNVMAGLGFQEILSPVLSSKNAVHDNMRSTGKELIEIENVMAESYSVVRNWALPSLLSCLSKNLHNEYPQKIFELGECAEKIGEETRTLNKLAVCISDTSVGYEDISSVLDSFLSSLGLKYRLEEAEHGSFIKGRAAKIVVDEKVIGVIGEVHPEVLNNFGIEMPVVGFEIDIDEIF